MSHYNSRYNDSPDAWPLTSSCGGGCGGSAPRIGASPMPQWFDESWQPDYVPKATVAPRTAMPRYFPDEQPDAVLPRYGVQRPVPSMSYDDYPDSPNFYTPRSPMMMQPPGIQHPGTTRPWDDGPDTDNFYRQTSHSPQIRQVITARPWDDGPDTDNFYRQANGGPPARQAITARPWDDGPDTDNFYRQASPARITRPESLSRPWDDYPDTDNFYKQISPSIRAKQVITSRPWDDYPDTDNFYRQRSPSLPTRQVPQDKPWDDGPDTDNFYRRSSVNLPRYPVQQEMEQYLQPGFLSKRSGVLKWLTHSSLYDYNVSRQKVSPHFSLFDYKDFYENQCPQDFLPLRYRKNETPHPIGHFFSDPYLQTGAFYGRAVASINGGSCTGWNIGGPYLLTAGHCEDPNDRNFLVFGRYGTTWGDAYHLQGVVDLWNRLEQLGIPKEQIIAIGPNGALPINGRSWQSLLYDLPRLGNVGCVEEKGFLYNELRNQAIATNVRGKSIIGSGGLGSYLLEGVDKFVPSQLPLFKDIRFSPFENVVNKVIGGVGNENILSCPPNFAASGVVGSEVSSRVGNFGLVCMPYTDPWFYRWSFAHAVVVASGSLDVSILPSMDLIKKPMSGYDFRTVGEQDAVPLDVYMNEYLSTFSPKPRDLLCGDWGFVEGHKRQSFQQKLKMCPPGFYIQNIKFVVSNGNSMIQEISEMTCRSWDNTQQIIKKIDIGNKQQLSTEYLIDCGTSSTLTSIVSTVDSFFNGLRSFGCRRRI